MRRHGPGHIIDRADAYGLANLSGNAALLLLAYLRVCNSSDGTTLADGLQVAERAGITAASSCRAAHRALESAGLIERLTDGGGRGKAARYRLVSTPQDDQDAADRVPAEAAKPASPLASLERKPASPLAGIGHKPASPLAGLDAKPANQLRETRQPTGGYSSGIRKAEPITEPTQTQPSAGGREREAEPQPTGPTLGEACEQAHAEAASRIELTDDDDGLRLVDPSRREASAADVARVCRATGKPDFNTPPGDRSDARQLLAIVGVDAACDLVAWATGKTDRAPIRFATARARREAAEAATTATPATADGTATPRRNWRDDPFSIPDRSSNPAA